MESNTVRIPLNQLQIGMVSSEDIYSSSGLLLIGKKTPITQTHLFRLKLYQIFYVSVYNDQMLYQEAPTDKTPPTHGYEEDPHYIAFKRQYVVTLKEINELIYTLISGKDVTDELYVCCNKLLSVLPKPEDLFHYLYTLDSGSEKEASLKHCLNVGLYCSIVGTWLGFEEQEIRELTLAGLLHDLGKFEIADEIINKPGKLTDEEFAQIKLHPLIGFDKIKHSFLSYSIKMSILQHHERIDGSGYPFGFQSNEIHPYAQIVTIIDIYDAMTSDRTYHKRQSPFSVINILEKDGYHMLNHEYLSVFLEKIASLYTNRTVLLSNGEKGKIIFINRSVPSRPMVQIGTKIYNLEFELGLNIVDLVR